MKKTAKSILSIGGALFMTAAMFFWGCDNPANNDNPNPGDNPGNGDPVATAAVSFYSGTYSSGTDADLDAHSDAAWALTAGEYAAAYFGVTKEAAQTVTVSGADAAKVTAADNDGGSVSASGTLALFKVDTADCVFEGGARGFTLDVSEEGKTARTVAVNLRVAPDYTGAALFHVTAAGLERLDTGEDAAANLLDAIKLFDTEAEDENEYLIRVEGNENKIPMIYFNRGDGYSKITLRLRGVTKAADGSALGERVIENDKTQTTHGTYNSSYKGLFSIRTNGEGSPGDIESVSIFFYLGNNITIQGRRVQDSDSGYLCVFQMENNNHITMEAGSKITGHDTTDVPYCDASIFYLTAGAKNGKILIQNGAFITGNNVIGVNTDNSYDYAESFVAFYYNTLTDTSYCPFEKEAGADISNNGQSFVAVAKGSIYDLSDVAENVKAMKK